MDFFNVIENRKSTRKYNSERPVDEQKLRMILNAGRLAPSAANRQPWTFYVVSSAGNLEKIRKCYGKNWFDDAPHVIIVAGRRNDAWSRTSDGYNSLETDLTIAMDHIILAAEAAGLGTCWIAAFDPEKLKQTGIVDNDEEVFAITPLGYPADGDDITPQKNRKPLDEIVRFV
jgi:nitroreductase